MSSLQEIQRLRGMACILVFVQHVCCVVPLLYFMQTIPWVLHYASCGVHLFFAISGFVIALSMKNKLEACCVSDNFDERLYAAKNELKAFFTKRFFRLVPCFILSVLLYAAFELLFTHDMEKMVQALRQIPDTLAAMHPCYVSRLAYTETVYYSGAGLYWTLAVEIFFYLAWPIVFLALKNNSSRVKFSLLLGGLCWAAARWIMCYALKEPECVYYSIFTNIDGLLLGSFLGLTYQANDKTEGNNSKIWCVASIFMILIMWMHPNMFKKFSYHWQEVSVLFSVGLVWLAAYNKGVLNIPVFKNFLEYLGSRSYSFYIYQMFLIYATKWLAESSYMPLSGDKHFKTAMIFVVALFIIAELSFRFVETPFRKLGNKIADSFK